MAEITAAMVKDLREKTGVGMMDCKKALAETQGDFEAAVDWLRAKGLSKAAKKADRVASEGLVGVVSKAVGAGSVGAVVELNSETDFVARNDTFKAAVSDIAAVALGTDGTVASILAAAYKGAGSGTVSDVITNMIATIGENMTLRRTAVISANPGVVASYVHSQVGEGIGRIGVLVALESEGSKEVLADLGRKVAMHVAAVAPLSARVDELDPAVIQRERAIFIEQAAGSGKPPAVVEKMVEGRIRKFFEEVVLEHQAFVMNPDVRVGQLIKDSEKAAGAPIKLKGFVRFNLGEGVEKAKSDFADEVAQLTGQS
jgi:elongation factor Ts